jgi:tetratricopeptide (TPR) repeat protein
MNENPHDFFKEFEIAYKKAKTSKEKFKVLRPNTYFLESYNHTKIPVLFEELIKMAEEEGNTRGIYVFYLYLNSYYRNQGLYDKGLRLLLLSKTYFFENADMATYYKTMSDIAVSMYDLGQKRQAVYLWKEILNFQKNIKDESQQYILRINIIYASLVDFNNTNNIEASLIEMLNFNGNQKELTRQIHNTAYALYALFYYNKKNYKKAIECADKSIEIALENNEVNNLFDVYKILSDCYEKLKDEKNWLLYLRKAENLCKDNKSFIKAIPVYNSLYLYYKSKDDYNKAFKYHESKHILELYKMNQQNEINNILKNLGFENSDSIHNYILNEYSKKFLFDFNRDIFLENSKGTLVKINIDSIVYVESSSKMIKIHFVDKTSFIFKASMKEFSDLIHEKFSNDHLFFNTNLRNEMVNLFWMSKFDKLNKKLYVNVLGEETSFEVTRTQSNVLRDFLKIT